ncbi:M1 family metallopeptidase [Pedobacter polaris]|uniref:M1 family metallopeptidase n=1 Tax=Pedobacter polaris TaxID=2571273 RepID=A0A4U1CSG8_9SPHI|nr:M1 family metallopeptidase [Pedobacter polaris]TKC09975.1 M1 family metallopeptidase [Pedobacter polaris]
MNKLLLLFLTFFCLTANAQNNYWQQNLNYTIDVSLNDTDKSLIGFEKLVYKNNSPSNLDFIWFHIYPNAYKNESTAMFQQIKNDPSRKKKLEKYSLGSIEGLNFKVNGQVAITESHPNPQYIDVIKVKLQSPLKPGDSVTITTDFKVTLPTYFSRSGFADGEFMVTQWYPKPAVFDKDGWHEFPYLDMGEFYSEYADYKVNITLPAEYVVGATGILQNADELEQYKITGAINYAQKTDKPALYVAKDKTANKTLSYVMKNVPDFAWFADKKYVISYDTLKLASGKSVDVFTYYYNKKKSLWLQSVDYVKDAVKKYSNWIGEYEYPVVQVVEGPKNNASGGMEYPTITLITSPDAKPESLDAVITHEVGHNWFMSILGNNERANTWQDEGLNTYYQFRYEAEKYKTNSIFGDALPANVKALPVDQFQAAIYNAIMGIPMKPAIATSAEKFATSDDYGITSYVKTALWMYLLEASVGRDKVDNAFKAYFNEWKNKHPSPQDMKTSFEKSLGTNLDSFFELLNKEGSFK